METARDAAATDTAANSQRRRWSDSPEISRKGRVRLALVATLGLSILGWLIISQTVTPG